MGNANSLIEAAEEAGWVYRLERTPLLVFRPPMTRLVAAIRKMLLKEVAQPYGFEEYIFPRFVPEEVLVKTGWLTHHRHEAWLVDPKPEFIYNESEEGLFPKADAFPANPLPYALDPIQCVSLYYALFNDELNLAELPIKAVEYQGGWTFRRESHVVGLLRDIEFLRLEFVWIGTRDQAIQLRDWVLKKAAETVRDFLGLPVLLAEGDSCFLQPAPKVQPRTVGIEKFKEIMDEPSLDIIVPHDGGYLEVASATRYKEIAPRFKIRIAGSQEVPWSGCLGLGLTRLAGAFLEKHGFDPNRWENVAPLKRFFDEMLVSG